ncbi:diaminohydroxyphosphoribosylaminopyrimidine deaminase [Desulfonispora thiosulfatigenes DSM 11270]|uniref:Riboflavin biosynthesis protein RibD n=1 Tax=Desulfonispora thiosulfatigenes DSM 11270 TaxID=656914 RepID=A0A1W1VHH8_DESTI|nr:bifunctional diaminohydroxyphosphoribosylaminopyrimidine deaminase/5-amino-6-(5-phosphoribosylamino)uracil reductase RibD [Desulfonispora thiosulfatigenes]SMB92827.1 diaminohydroxyphosphoribosylaminopyrimidine deaminase [Desulfonispora thiosulfatigenes DSM 11270]
MKNTYMEKALHLAEKALGRTAPNPVVGAVVVNKGEIVGIGYHQKAGSFHAERIALNDAKDKAKGADLYVTLEPCNHYGKTPPCTQAIIEAGIKNVYVSTLDPNPKVSGKGIEKLKENGINVEVGLKEEEAKRLNEFFFKYIQTGLPFVAIKGASSLDGKIATSLGESKWITGEKARNHGHSLRNIYDAIMVGKNTVLSDNPSLNCRISGGRDPVRIVVDSKLSISSDANILNLNSEAKTIIATTTSSEITKQKELAIKAEVIVVNEGDQVNLKKLLEILASKGITSILVEGGATLTGSLFSSNLVDKVYFYKAPLIIGGDKAKGLIGGEGFKHLDKAIKLKDLKVEPFGNDLLISAYVKG